MFVRSVEAVGKNAWYAVLLLASFFGKHLFIVSPCTLMLKATEIAQYLLQNFFSAYSCCFNTLVFSEIPDTQFYPGWMFQEVA